MPKPPQAVVNAAINNVLTKWAVDFIDQRQADARAKLDEASGKGQRSFDHAVVKAEGEKIAQALFAFNAYLRTFDMRRLEWSKQPPLEEIEKYIKEKGADKFIAKYKANNPGRQFPVRAVLINKIAWGISISKFRKLKRRKRKQWYSKSYNTGITDLLPLLSDALSRESLKELKRELQ